MWSVIATGHELGEERLWSRLLYAENYFWNNSLSNCAPAFWKNQLFNAETSDESFIPSTLSFHWFICSHFTVSQRSIGCNRENLGKRTWKFTLCFVDWKDYLNRVARSCGVKWLDEWAFHGMGSRGWPLVCYPEMGQNLSGRAGWKPCDKMVLHSRMPIHGGFL